MGLHISPTISFLSSVPPSLPPCRPPSALPSSRVITTPACVSRPGRAARRRSRFFSFRARLKRKRGGTLYNGGRGEGGAKKSRPFSRIYKELGGCSRSRDFCGGRLGEATRRSRGEDKSRGFSPERKRELSTTLLSHIPPDSDEIWRNLSRPRPAILPH